MKSKMLKGIVTLEMSREEAAALTIATKSVVSRIMDKYEKYGELGMWDDLAILGKATDALGRLSARGGKNGSDTTT